MTAEPGAPRVSAVVVSYNAREHLLRCLRALEPDAALPLEVIVVDNASADGSAAAVREAFPAARVLEAGANLGFSRANNLGIREAEAPYVLLLNPDAELRPGSITALVGLLEEHGDIGIAGPRTLSGDGSPQVSFGEGLTPFLEWRQQALVRGVRARRPEALSRAREAAGAQSEPGWISGACMMARRSALLAVGGFDEAFFLYEEDVDLCLRLRRAGWRIVFTPTAEVVHHLGRSVQSDPWRSRLEYHRSHLLFYGKHNGPLQTLLLRAWLMAGAATGLLGSLGSGEERRRRRTHHREVLGLALRG
jgi:N-acetylglucosaminyl-diphospho-decaprenol L-rhamnosyltransferase